MSLKEQEGYSTHCLPNGLTIQLKEMHTAPIISGWIWYKVGLRNEHPGKTGLSHWVEHMQFKGTPKFPPSVLDKMISRLGGNWNAFTYLDWTTYYETLPAYAFEIALELESDRMVNSEFSQKEVELERTVVISEREGSENNPFFLLGEAVGKASFTTHPYRYDIGGEMADLNAISRDELFNHYQTHYHPANAIISICGDFSTPEMLKLVQKHFTDIPSKPQVSPEITPDPKLQKAKKVTLKGPGETKFIQMSYRSPKADSSDFFSLTILDSLFTGPSGLNMFGSGGISNKTSRLYQALVETEITVSAHGNLQATIDPYLYILHFIVHPDRSPGDVIQVVNDQIHRLQDNLVQTSELERAVKQARALFAYGSENITNQAFWMGYSSIFADYEWFTKYVDRLSQVTPEMIIKVAQNYLQSENRVIGVYLPGSDQVTTVVEEE